MNMLSFEEFQEEIGNEGALGKLSQLASDVKAGFGDLAAKYREGGVQAVKKQMGENFRNNVNDLRQTVSHTLIKNAPAIEKHLEGLSEAGDKIKEIVKVLPTPVQTLIKPELTLVTSGINLAHETMRDINEGKGLPHVTEKLVNTLHNVQKACTQGGNKLENAGQALHDSTEKGKVENARKKLKEISLTVGKVLGMIGGSGAVGYVGYKGYQKVTGSNEDFYGLEDITESNYSEITELLTEVKHIIDTSTSTNDLYSKLQHLEKAKRKELQDVVYGRFTSLPDHKKVELNHLLVEISDGCRAKNITLEQAFSTSPWIWRAFKKTCTLVGVTLNMILKGALVAGTAGAGLFAYKNREVAKAVWKGIKGLKSGVGLANIILKR